MKKISLLHAHAVRIINNAKKASHTNLLFFKYKILKLTNDLTDFNQATYALLKIWNNLPPGLKRSACNIIIGLKKDW